MPARVTVTLRSVGPTGGTQGYSVTIAPWKVPVSKGATPNSQEIEWKWLSPQASITIQGAQVDFGSKTHFTGTRARLGSDRRKAHRTGTVKPKVAQRTYNYEIKLYFTQNGQKRRIQIDPDYRVDP